MTTRPSFIYCLRPWNVLFPHFLYILLCIYIVYYLEKTNSRNFEWLDRKPKAFNGLLHLQQLLSGVWLMKQVCTFGDVI